MKVNIELYDKEFPLLEEVGLYAKQTTGDGDCLFHALSDQLYGHENSHHELRQRVVDHLRANASYFKAFVNVAPVRRAPRRRAAASSNQDFETFTENEIDKAFEERMQRMEKSGVFGDNMEIQAFAREFNVNVKIFRKDYAYVISADNTSGNAVQRSEGKGFVYVAYHTWEHYSSIRNRDGPHAGPPYVRDLANEPDEDIEILPWMIEAVEKGLPEPQPKEKIREALQEAQGDPQCAIEYLINGWDCELE
ncbi:hypothetical protein FPQ18DRAFT_253444, partial [Pyronema domesticum]